MARRKAAILTIGTEITDGEVVDTNSACIANFASDLGLEVDAMISVPDRESSIESALTYITSNADIGAIFVCGGLGPTGDDFTREVVARFCGLELELNSDSVMHITELLKLRGSPVTENQKTQCWFPKGSQILKNPVGTAHGFRLETQNASGAQSKMIVVLPGPPREMSAVLALARADLLSAFQVSSTRTVVRIRTSGIGEGRLESFVAERLGGRSQKVGYRAHLPFVDIKFWVDPESSDPDESPSVVREKTSSLRADIERQFGQDAVVDFDGDELLRTAIQALALSRPVVRTRIRDAATGGLLQSRIFALSEAIATAQDPESPFRDQFQILDAVRFSLESLTAESRLAAHEVRLDQTENEIFVAVDPSTRTLSVTHVPATGTTEVRPTVWTKTVPSFFGDLKGYRARTWALEFAAPEVARLLVKAASVSVR